MKKYIVLAVVLLLIVLSLSVAGLYITNHKLRESNSIYDSNFKALCLENKNLENQAIAYKLNIEQLEYINDSIIDDLNNTRRKLQIKDRELLQMQNIKTEISTKDSIFIRDTIFRDSFAKLDTVIRDNWHKLAVSLTPQQLTIKATYKSDLQVFAKSSKEILGTPKKCFIARWFQRKHKVVRVEVIDKNPYSEIKEKKFVIIE